MSAQRADVVVAGGGVIGLLTARELALAGCQVCVLERGRVGREASWAGGGILSPLYPWRYPEAVNVLAAWSQIHYPALCRDLAQHGPDPEWTPSGLLILDRDEAGRALAWGKGYRDLRNRWLDPPEPDPWVRRARADAVTRLAPALEAGGGDALWLPGVAQLRNPRFLRALRAAVESIGVRILEQAGLRGFRRAGGRLAAVVSSAGEIRTPRCVVAAGAWSGRLLAGAGLAGPPVRPVKGQMIQFAPVPGLLGPVVLSGGRYLIPRRDGRILAGSTVEEAGFDKTGTAGAREELMQFARCLVPRLQGVAVERQWAGLRPGSPRGVPFIGPHPGLSGLFVNTGHFRNGFALGPASARLAADWVLGRPPLVDPGPYSWPEGGFS